VAEGTIFEDEAEWAYSKKTQVMNILPKVAPETARKQDASILAAFALHDMQLTMIQIHILEPHARQLRVSQPRIKSGA
jgi:hypothetical protein